MFANFVYTSNCFNKNCFACICISFVYCLNIFKKKLFTLTNMHMMMYIICVVLRKMSTAFHC